MVLDLGRFVAIGLLVMGVPLKQWTHIRDICRAVIFDTDKRHLLSPNNRAARNRRAAHAGNVRLTNRTSRLYKNADVLESSVIG